MPSDGIGRRRRPPGRISTRRPYWSLTIATSLALSLALGAQERADDHPAPAPERGYVVITGEYDGSPVRLSQKYLNSVDYWAQIAEHNLLRPGVSIRIPAGMLRADRIRARIAGHHGRVEIDRFFARRDRRQRQETGTDEPEVWIPVVEDLLVQQGDRIRTGPGGSALIQQDDGSEYRLRADSILLVEENRREGERRVTRLRLEHGSMSSRVQHPSPDSRFEVLIAGSTATVLGTEFRVELTPQGNPRLEVLTGEVELTTGNGDQRLRVTENEGYLVQQGAPAIGTPRRLPEVPGSLVFVGDGVVEGFEPDVLVWEPVVGAEQYELELATDPGFTDVACQWRVHTTQSAMKLAPTTLDSGSYYVRVSSIDAAGYHSAPSQPQALSYRK